ncbi:MULTISPECIES: C40 family peptidase [Mumia]|uniref:C40 family peptidase n=1 Tax=Mumia TaxID=1546255 RepID=UPI001AB04522|nr:C40 family peptidase [Mumia sp. ZJ430]
MFANPRMHRLVALPIALLAAFVMVVSTAGESQAATAKASTSSTKMAAAKTTAAKTPTAKQAKQARKKAKRVAAKKRRAARISKASRVAARQKGDPYRYGASGPGAFDCSGLTSYSFRRAGVKLPRTANSQYRHVRKIKKKNIRKGDLVFFGGSRKYHVGIYWGKGRILHAPYSGSRVKVERIWTKGWSAGTVRLRA